MTVEVAQLAEDLIRVGFFPPGRPPDYRSAAVAGEWEPLARLEPPGGVRFEVLEPAGAGIGDLLGPPLRVVMPRREGERFFGCGERTAGLEKTGSRQIFWNYDPPEGHTASLNNLYTSIPFVLSLAGGVCRGVFVDNPGRVEMDLAKADPGEVVYETATGNLVYYVFTGPTPAAVLERYTELTGRVGLPPLWALGNQQSRWGHVSADEVRSVADGFRSRGIPCDVLYLDIDYMDGFRVFTFDEERFPDPAAFIASLAEDGFRVVTIVDPGVKVDLEYPVYVEGRERGYYCRTFGDEEYRNVVWPGLCAFPDFTNPAAREWWGDNHAALLDLGVAGIWCDMNEPSLFVPAQSTMPADVVHPGGGEPRLHAQVHNLYGSGMAQATREGLARLRPDRRPFVISRAGFAGLQRHALQWTGDNSSWWEHLWMSLPQLQNLGLSGMAFCGVDCGGFFGDSNGELLARWTEAAVFQPFLRNHSQMGTVPQEPWAFGEPWESICRDMLLLRMRLLPYLYGAFEEASRTGAPVMRPLLFEWFEDEVTYTADDEFMLGDALLVAPITRPGIEHRHVYLPAGTWVHWWTGDVVAGPAHVLAHAPLGRPALYARANAAIPLWPERMHTGEPVDRLTLRVFAVPSADVVTRELYEDAGEGFGPSSRRSVTVDAEAVRVSAPVGAFAPAPRVVEVEVVRGGAAVVTEIGDGAAEITLR
ncbi:glycoside hydrolase family 31 protein [Candidatus Solirubrobacter pratensis]|uniref:glycoside hydrolase family 31 protein n=1 Tax=Candidatus Solirubrobacter pratensis TaxID=1298857 RepID=UPI000412EE7D|nr:TIM-barrel domain-containing protein [Candidatus Solirubrobacter pratensis]